MKNVLTSKSLEKKTVKNFFKVSASCLSEWLVTSIRILVSCEVIWMCACCVLSQENLTAFSKSSFTAVESTFFVRMCDCPMVSNWEIKSAVNPHRCHLFIKSKGRKESFNSQVSGILVVRVSL